VRTENGLRDLVHPMLKMEAIGIKPQSVIQLIFLNHLQNGSRFVPSRAQVQFQALATSKVVSAFYLPI
jgi:hypothetical protein